MSRRLQQRLWILAALGGLALYGLALATGGVYTQSKHGDAVNGVLRLAGEPVGDCAQCHDQHASRGGVPTSGPFEYLLFTDNDNMLCSTAGGAGGCHATAGPLNIFPGPTIYDASSHQTDSSMVWPGPDPRARPGSDSGLCLNCHTPHGRGDANGLIPSQVAVREEGSCLTCHDASGPSSIDISTDINKSSAHPALTYPDRHVAGESNPTAFGVGNRHAECEDCHNPHDVDADDDPTPPTASTRNQRVSRVAVTNGAAGTTPTYTFRAADDPAPVLEYEICFKCHSSWTTQPGGQSDTAVEFNPANYSYHPVEAQGKNLNIPAAAFANGWAPTDTMYCSDCHRSDDGVGEGPHGSIESPILLGPVTAPVQGNSPAANEQCLECHASAVYIDRSRESRFDSHSSHDDDGPCLICHYPHSPPDPDDPQCCLPGDPNCCMPDSQNCNFPGTPGECISLIRIVCDPANPAPGCTPGDGIIRLVYGTDTDDGECYATCHGPGTKPLRWGRDALPR